MKRSKGFTLIELLVVVAIIALLISILLPSLGRARDQAKSTKCLANLKALGLAVSIYANVNGDFCPPSAVNYNSAQNDWLYFPLLVDGALTNPNLVNPPGLTVGTSGTYPSLELRSVFVCPSTPNVLTRTLSSQNDSTDGYFEDVSRNFDKNLSFYKDATPPNCLLIQASYGFNGSVTTQTSDGTGLNAPNAPLQMITPAGNQNLKYNIPRKFSQMPMPSDLVFMYDGGSINPWTAPLYRIFGRHGTQSSDLTKSGKVNIAFFDGHAESAERADLPNAKVEWSDPITTLRSLHHDKYIWRLDQVQ